MARGIDPHPLLDSAGIAAETLVDPGARVPLARYAALYNIVVHALDDEGFCLFAARCGSAASNSCAAAW